MGKIIHSFSWKGSYHFYIVLRSELATCFRFSVNESLASIRSQLSVCGVKAMVSTLLEFKISESPLIRDDSLFGLLVALDRVRGY